MKRSVTLLIDSMGLGGAQRQMCLLASELYTRGYFVKILCYHSNLWSKEHFLGNPIPVRVISWKNKVGKIWNVYKSLREQKNDVIISFLKGPNILNVLSRFPYKTCKSIVSERGTDSRPFSSKTKLCFFLYRMADVIIVNSSSELNFIISNMPYLARKVKLVQNGVDLKRFVPDTQGEVSENDRLVFGVFGSYSEKKRPQDLILAVHKIVQKIGKKTPYFIWHGEYRNPFSGKNYEAYEAAVRLIAELGLAEFFDLRGPTSTPEEALRKVDCVCLASGIEGFPNCICEALACGKPVVATRAGDTPYLVTEGVTGFLAEARSPDSLASALLKMINSDGKKRLEMGHAARLYAEKNLSPERFVGQYLEIING